MHRFFYFLLLLSTSLKAQDDSKSQIFLADPTIIYAEETYFLYGTVEENPDNGLKVYSSKDQKTWIDRGFALKKGDSFGEMGFWAPQVFFYKNKYHMAYVANEHIAIAESDSPLGPFKQRQIGMLEAPVKQIDPFIFMDNKGKVYLYHVRLQEGNRIFVAELKPDLSAIIPETLQECIHSTEPWENTAKSNWPVAEGPTVIKKNGLYYLFYTSNDFRNPDYAVGYATSNSPLGPWKKYENNPILTKKEIGINGTGHGDLYTDKSGHLNYVFHTHYSNSQPRKRRTAIISVSKSKTMEDLQQPFFDFSTFHFLNHN